MTAENGVAAAWRGKAVRSRLVRRTEVWTVSSSTEDWEVLGLDQKSQCCARLALNHQQPDVAFETCRPGLGPLGRPSAGRASIPFADIP
jgi:hypothetical protein